MPERTSARGAGTRQAPWRQASHISSQEASKATDSPASTRSSGPSGSSLQEEPGLGVDEGGRRAVGDGDALGRAGGAGGEDDPGVVVRAAACRAGAGSASRAATAILPFSPRTAPTPASGRPARPAPPDRRRRPARRRRRPPRGQDRDVELARCPTGPGRRRWSPRPIRGAQAPPHVVDGRQQFRIGQRRWPASRAGAAGWAAALASRMSIRVRGAGARSLPGYCGRFRGSVVPLWAMLGVGSAVDFWK